MKTFLDEILADVRTELDATRARRPLAEIRRDLKRHGLSRREFYSLAREFAAAAEFHRRRPSPTPDEALELVNMSGHNKKMPVNLSGGMRKRVALARAIISPPQVILYDEPTAGLDPIMSDSINRLIRRLQKQLSVTSIVVTHDMTSCYQVADRVALLNEGRRHFYGTLDELRSTEDGTVRDFVDGRSEDDDH